jgi:hypothetical protein
MKKGSGIITIAVFCGALIAGLLPDSLAAQSCSSCHAAMAETPVTLPDNPPADVLAALSTPCAQYGRILEEWYYIEELFVTTEHHLLALHEDRYHVEPLAQQLVDSRALYRAAMQKPIRSLAEFQQITGKLRFDVGKVYREAKAHRQEQGGRFVFGIILIGTLGILFLMVTGWRVASGSGIVHPTETTLGYDALQQQAAEQPEEEVAE